MPWYRPFEDPVTLPDGTVLQTLQDAADYMMTLSAAEQKAEHWLLAGEVVIAAAEGRGLLVLARIGMLKAINHGRPAEPRRKRARQYDSDRLLVRASRQPACNEAAEPEAGRLTGA